MINQKIYDVSFDEINYDQGEIDQQIIFIPYITDNSGNKKYINYLTEYDCAKPQAMRFGIIDINGELNVTLWDSVNFITYPQILQKPTQIPPEAPVAPVATPAPAAPKIEYRTRCDKNKKQIILTININNKKIEASVPPNIYVVNFKEKKVDSGINTHFIPFITVDTDSGKIDFNINYKEYDCYIIEKIPCFEFIKNPELIQNLKLDDLNPIEKNKNIVFYFGNIKK
jgi:hypothetical protein